MKCQKPGCSGTATHMVDLIGRPSETWYACDCVWAEDGLALEDGFFISEHLPEDIDKLAEMYPPSPNPYPTREDGVRAFEESMRDEDERNLGEITGREEEAQK